ncbi:HAD family hydrolase [Desmospora activa]|uniref:Putative hydrolase of the HAD superfamily n=1 Tax=Desmospora activa DSM 45169 TaxID=1121389 RepID=A0A2T4Z3L8_9BACL|nr:HAD family hydrolase [Desmospora activa]PTM56484.1 putative hydrolase of the HAD superfamily [Desmospora activa DSM 45169]
MTTNILAGRLIIFDLDGTLYEDTAHFDYYASLLKENLPLEKRDDFARTYRQILAGNHPLTIGKVYDVNRDAILSLDPATLEVQSVCDWDGAPWSQNRIHQTYSGSLTLDFDQIVAIGDGWWIPFAVAKHFGAGETYPFYVKTKEYLAAHEHLLTRTPGLKAWLQEQRQAKTLVLVTNSDQDDVQRLLSRLHLDGLFHQIVTSARKPTHTSRIFQNLLRQHQVSPEETISIGDNYINEIAPALQLGMKAILLQNSPFTHRHERLQVVRSMSDLF